MNARILSRLLVLLLWGMSCLCLWLGAIFIIYTNPSWRLIKTKIPPRRLLHGDFFEATACSVWNFLVAFQWAESGRRGLFKYFEFRPIVYKNSYWIIKLICREHVGMSLTCRWVIIRYEYYIKYIFLTNSSARLKACFM